MNYIGMRDGYHISACPSRIVPFFVSMQRFFCLFFSLFVFTSGCSTTGSTYVGHRYDEPHVIEGVPFYPQEDYQCGPASLASVLNYLGTKVTPEDVAKDIYRRSAKGTLNIDMVLYAQSKGLEASWYSGGWDDLTEKIKAGWPLIVLVDNGFSILQVNHFMVVTGYDEGVLIANSGREQNRQIPLKDFLRVWERANFWTLLIKKP